MKVWSRLCGFILKDSAQTLDHLRKCLQLICYFIYILALTHALMQAIGYPRTMAQLQKYGIILLTCFAFIVSLCYLFASKSRSYLPKNETSTILRRRRVTGPPISLSLRSHIHAHHHIQPRSFKEIFLAFPWTEFERVVAKNLKEERLQYTKLFIDELTYFLELEPLVPINESCTAPPLLPPTAINCSHPTAFNGMRRREPARVGALLQFGFDVDVLEIHMNELYGVVDVFFIIESTHAHFENIKKPLIWEHVQQQDRFTKFPVVHFIIDDAESLKATDKKWSMEALQERLRWTKFLEWNEATRYFDDQDVIGFGDVDEIPSRDRLNMFKYCEIKEEAVGFGIWFPFGHINQTFKSDYPVSGHPFTLGDPTYYTLASAKAYVKKKFHEYPNRRRGHSSNFILGGIHMSHYGYLPFQLIKYLTATESNLRTLNDVVKLSKYLKIGDIRTMETDFAATPKNFSSRIKEVDLSNKEMKEICVLPWFYDCNRARYPVWEGGHDTRLDATNKLKSIIKG